MFSWRKVLLLVLGSSLTAWPQAQTSPPNNTNPTPTLRTRVRLVVVDVVVSNNKGEPVPGLKKEDFEVSEDGKPQTVSVFEEHRGVRPTQIKLPPMPPGVYTNFPVTQTADSVNIILLDALNTPSSDQTYVHSQMLKYLRTIPPRTRVAIFTLASRLIMLQGITTDSSRLLAALNSEKAGPSQSPLRPSTVESDANQSRVDFMSSEAPQPASPDQTLAQAEVDPINATKQFLSDTATFQTESRIGMTLEALQQLGRYLSGVPGRKNVIWFSGSFPAGVVPNSDLVDPFSAAVNFKEGIRKTTDLLTTAHVALYPVAAEGLVSDSAFQVNNRQISEKRGNMAMQDTIDELSTGNSDRDASHASMEQLAKETGGQAFYNTNGLSDALTRVVNNGSHFYTLAYAPTNANMDGKYRHIQVKLASSKDSLAYRRGYYADELSTALSSGPKQNADPLLRLMGRNMPDYTQILYKVLVQPSNPQPPADAPRAGSNSEIKGPVTRYGIDFAVAAEDLRLEQGADAVRHGAIEIMLVAYDREGKPLNLVVGRSEIQIPAKDYANVQRGGLQIHKEIDIPKGDSAFLRTGVYDLKSNNAGTLGLPLSAGILSGK
ncbi:MAG TPA: VWA domain-containing protein [Candidatus Sulfotelmatobacter sp.]|nr:VWA domain-containing protein [Candidatus Sulfotelmatobacter sp.]